MPRKLTRGEWESMLRGRHVCVLATIGLDKEPVLTPIWYLYRDGRIVIRTGADSIKARNVGRDPRVTVCVQDEHAPYKSVTVYGKATIEPDTEGLPAEVSRHYLGTIGGFAYIRSARAEIEQTEAITIVVTPERVVTQDYSPETPFIGRFWLKVKRVLPPWL